MSIGLLKTGNALFGVIRPLLFSANAEALYVYRERLERLINILVFDDNGKASLNLYSGAVLAGIRRDSVISGLKRQLKNANRPTKS